MRKINLPSILNQREMFVDSFDQVFDEMVKVHFPEFTNTFGVNFISKGSYPKCDVIDYPTQLKIIAEIAGLTKSDVDIEIKKDILTISGKSLDNHNEEKAVFVKKELKHSSFKRSFALSDKLDTDKIDASFRNGILTITIGKKQAEIEISKRIEIK